MEYIKEMNRYNKKSMEELSDVPKIYVVSISDFLDSYQIDLKQKISLVRNYLDNFFARLRGKPPLTPFPKSM